HAIKPAVQFEKLCRGEPIVETKMFRKKTNFAASLDVANRAAQNLRFAARGKYQAQQHFYGRTLAGPVWSQETENLTPGNIEGEVSHGHFPAENLAQPAGSYGKVGRSDYLHRSIDQRSEAARLKASDELPCPPSEWITPLL